MFFIKNQDHAEFEASVVLLRQWGNVEKWEGVNVLFPLCVCIHTWESAISL